MADQFEFIQVSPEMVTLIGAGEIAGLALPQGSMTFVISLGQPASVRIVADSRRQRRIGDGQGGPAMALVVMKSALKRLFDWSPTGKDGNSYFLGSELAAIVSRMMENNRGAEAMTTYRLAKSIELLCDIMAAFGRDELIPLADGAGLSHSDGQRLAAARRIIDEQWAEKLTLNQIARLCGLNRSKLSRGFREIYRCSVTEALAQKRLVEARRQLLSTDLPVGVIGYRSGYSNNASFTRAFGRHFGVSPTDLRSCGMAA